MRTFLCFLIVALTLAAPAAIGSTFRISCDSIGGVISQADSIAVPGTVLKFYLRYTNTSDSGFNITNAFIISSPDGATWTDSASGNFRGANLGPIGIDTTGLLSKSLFPTVYLLRSYKDDTAVTRADGISPDVVSFEAAAADVDQGLIPHFDGHHFTILIQTKLADTGRTICIDSIMKWKCCQVWKWSALYPTMGQLTPAWGGRHCVKLVYPCAGRTGNIDCDSTDAVDIADVTALLDHLFISFKPLCAPGEANCDRHHDPNVDIDDLTALIDYLFLSQTPLNACE